MKLFKHFTMIAFFLLIFTSIPVWINAEETEITDEYVEPLKDINVYDAEDNIVGILLKGTSVKIESKQNSKIAIQWNKDLGYIEEAYVQSSSPSTPADLQINLDEEIEIITRDTTNVYSCETDAEIILTFSQGIEYSVIPYGEKYILNFGGRLGYVVNTDVDTINNKEYEQEVTNQEKETLIDSLAPDANKEVSQEKDIQLKTVEKAEAPKTFLENEATMLFRASDKYFKVIEDNVEVFDNRSGTLVPIGYLLKGETYKRVSDYGNWHQVKIGNMLGYVWKGSTSVANTPGFKNENIGLSSSSELKFRTLEELKIYDNTSGSLMPFGALKKGQVVNVISVYGSNWLKVDYSGRVGYLYKPSTTREFTINDRYFKVIEDNLPVYDNSSGTLVQVGNLNKNQTYKRVSDYGNWHQIKLGDKYVYVLKSATAVVDLPNIKNENKTLTTNTQLVIEFLEDVAVYDNTSGELVPFGIVKKGYEMAAISAPSGNWVQVDFSGRVGYVYKPSTTRQFTESDRYFKVIENNLAVYDNSSGTLVQVGTLNKNQTYKRISDYGNWHQVKLGDKYAYVLKDSTLVVDLPNIKNENKNLTTNNQLVIEFLEDVAVYDNTSGELVPFGMVKKGYKMAAISNPSGNWVQVDFSGRVGYVYKPSTTRQFTVFDRYFKVLENELKVYDNSTGSLREIGALTKGQVYRRVSDYGNWHQIVIGNKYGFVLKSATSVVETPDFKNENNSNINGNLLFKPKENINVFDNTSGLLVPFGTINKGELFSSIGDYGANWLKIDFSGRVGYVLKSSIEKPPTPLAWRTIVLDAGHGGTDPGASGNKYKEKDLTLRTVLELADTLKKQGANVILTRDGDYYKTLSERANISIANKADAFISVHYNKFPTNPSVSGIETYYYSKGKDLNLANAIHNGIVNAVTLKDRGVRYGNFHVLRENSRPAVLLELGYLSNSSEENFVGTDAYRKQAISGIIEGLKHYFSQN